MTKADFAFLFQLGKLRNRGQLELANTIERAYRAYFAKVPA